MENANRLLEQISYFWKKRGTFKGLVGFLLLINFFFLTIVGWLYSPIKDLVLAEGAGNLPRFICLILIFYCIVNFGVLLMWTYWRSLPQIPIGKIGLIFAPHSDPECTDLIYRIFDRFKIDMEKRKLSKEITYKLLSEKQIVSDSADARKLLRNTGARLVIHGFIQQGKIKGDIVRGFKTISFTVKHRELKPYEIKPVMIDLVGAFAYRSFVINEKNSFIEKDTVIKNISEVSLFFIAMGLALDGKTMRSQKILENLLENMEDKIHTNPRNAQLRIFKNSIESCLSIVLLSQFTYEYEHNLIENITNRSFDKYADECLHLLNRLIAIEKAQFAYYLNLAIIHFHYDRMKAAREAIKKAKKLSLDKASPYFSSAFLHIWRGEYRKGLKEYIRAEKYSYDVKIVIRVLLFLQGLVKSFPDKIELYFCLGIVNDKFFDLMQALEDYGKFLNKAQDDPKFTLLYDYSRKRIEILKG